MMTAHATVESAIEAMKLGALDYLQKPFEIDELLVVVRRALPRPDGVLQLVTVPIALGKTNPEILGTLSVGFLLDDALAAQLKEITGSDIAFAMDGQVLATTLRPEDPRGAGRSAPPVRSSEACGIGSEEYVALPRPLAATAEGAATGSGPVVLILRSRTEQILLLQAIRTCLAGTAVVAVLLATLLSFAVARTITRPLAAITDVMREVAATGDLTRKIAVLHASRWDDEDARLLATTFNTLTDSIARFQREMSQKGAAVVARAPVDRHRARSPQPADDHQGVAPRAAPAGRQRGGAARRRSPTSTKKSCGSTAS